MAALGAVIILIGVWWIVAAIWDWGILFWDWDALIIAAIVGEQITRWLILACGVFIVGMGVYCILNR